MSLAGRRGQRYMAGGCRQPLSVQRLASVGNECGGTPDDEVLANGGALPRVDLERRRAGTVTRRRRDNR